MRIAGSLGLLVLLAALISPTDAGAAAHAAQDPAQPPATTPPTAAPPEPAPAQQVTDPLAGLRVTERIARRYGPLRAKRRYLISTAGIPEGIDHERFIAMAETQGARWGLRPDGVTFDAVSLRNGRPEVGFSTRVPGGVLGIHYRRFLTRYKRFVRCRVLPDGSRRGCVTVGVRKIGTVITDRDIVLHPGAPWALGPAWPEPDEFDLQTVLIHEFGHFAGNDQHDANCTVAPMTPSLSPGDWWRSTLDHRVVCRKGARSAARRPASMSFAHRDLVSRVYETQFVGGRAAGQSRS